MENPFELIDQRLDRLERMLEGIIDNQQKGIEPDTAGPELTIGVPEALVVLGICRETLYKRISTIPHIKKHRRLRFYKSKLIKYMNTPNDESIPSINKYKRRKR